MLRRKLALRKKRCHSRKGTRGVPPRLRPAAAETSGMTEEEKEDADLRYLERVLGIRRGKPLPKGFADDGLLDLVESLRSDSELSPSDEEEEEEEETKMGTDRGGGGDDEAEEAPKKKKQKRQATSTQQQQQQQPRVEEEKPKEETQPTAQVTVRDRASERAAVLESASGKMVLRQVKGQMNKLADSNIESIFNELRKLALSCSAPELHEAVCQCVIASTALGGATAAVHIVVHAALVALLHITNSGAEIGGLLLENVAERLIKHRAAGETADATSFAVLLAHMYNLRIIGCSVIYGLVRDLIASFNATDIEILLALLRQAGPHLRRDDPSALKDIILAVQSRAASLSSSSSASLPPRVQYMLDMIYDLKNGRHVELPELLLEDRLRKPLQKIAEKHRTTLGTNEIRITWEELTSTEVRGRWWVVGSAYATVSTTQEAATSSLPTAAAAAGGPKSEEEKLAALARKHRMNTDARRAVFGILLSSEDYLDAYQKVVRLGLKGQDERDIAIVLLYCCARERTFNPYYQHLALQLCELLHPMRFSFQTAFWDKFKQVEEMKPREASNLATLLAHLVGSQAVPLSVLKGVRFETLHARGVLFFRTFFETLLCEYDEQTLCAVFKKLAVRLDDPSLLKAKEGIALFYLQGLDSNSKGSNDDPEEAARKQLVRKRARMTKRILLDSASADLF